MTTNGYPEEFKAFNPGFILPEANHPLLSTFHHSIFQKIIRFSDQAIFIINHSNFEYVYISGHVKEVMGYSKEEFISGGGSFAASTLHPDDAISMQRDVFPSYFQTLAMLDAENQARLKLAYTYRMKQPDGSYKNILQQNIALTMEATRVILGLAIVMDITAFKKDTTVYFKNSLIGDKEKTRSQYPFRTSNIIFTSSELKVLALTADGHPEKQIADTLSISINTVKTHRKNMLKKASVKNAAELVRFGMANLLI